MAPYGAIVRKIILSTALRPHIGILEYFIIINSLFLSIFIKKQENSSSKNQKLGYLIWRHKTSLNQYICFHYIFKFISLKI